MQQVSARPGNMANKRSLFLLPVFVAADSDTRQKPQQCFSKKLQEKKRYRKAPQPQGGRGVKVNMQALTTNFTWRCNN